MTDSRLDSGAAPLFGDGIDLRTAQMIVWTVHWGQMPRALMYLRARGIVYTEDKLHRKASDLRYHFQVDAARTVRDRCALCNGFLSKDETLLCSCYLKSIPGEYIEPTLFAIEQAKLSYPNNWQVQLQSTYICSNKTCLRLNDIPLGVVASDLRKINLRYVQQLREYELAVARGEHNAVQPREPVWRPKTKCHACYTQDQKGDKRHSTVPPKRNDKLQEKDTSLASLISALAPTAES